MRSKFKDEHPFEKRKAEAERIRQEQARKAREEAERARKREAQRRAEEAARQEEPPAEADEGSSGSIERAPLPPPPGAGGGKATEGASADEDVSKYFRAQDLTVDGLMKLLGPRK